MIRAEFVFKNQEYVYRDNVSDTKPTAAKLLVPVPADQDIQIHVSYSTEVLGSTIAWKAVDGSPFLVNLGSGNNSTYNLIID